MEDAPLILMLIAMAVTLYGVFTRFVCERLAAEGYVPARWRAVIYALVAHLLFLVDLNAGDSSAFLQSLFAVGATSIIIISLLDYRRSFRLLDGGKK